METMGNGLTWIGLCPAVASVPKGGTAMFAFLALAGMLDIPQRYVLCLLQKGGHDMLMYNYLTQTDISPSPRLFHV
jgi:hypothetical protein